MTPEEKFITCLVAFPMIWSLWGAFNKSVKEWYKSKKENNSKMAPFRKDPEYALRFLSNLYEELACHREKWEAERVFKWLAATSGKDAVAPKIIISEIEHTSGLFTIRTVNRVLGLMDRNYTWEELFEIYNIGFEYLRSDPVVATKYVSGFSEGVAGMAARALAEDC